MQGKDDERCPKCQSEELFVSLYARRRHADGAGAVPRRDHRFLGEGTPSCREDASERIVHWLERFAGRRADAAPGGIDAVTPAGSLEPAKVS